MSRSSLCSYRSRTAKTTLWGRQEQIEYLRAYEEYAVDDLVLKQLK